MSATYVPTRHWVIMGWLSFVVLAATPDARAQSAAEAFAKTNIERSYTILRDTTLSASERQRRLRELLQSMIDAGRIARFTLGPYARTASPSDLADVERTFGEFVAEVYQIGLSNFSAMTVTGSTQRAPDDTIVNVAATRTGQRTPQQIAFRVRIAEDGRQTVTDLQIEGAWLALSQREEFTSYLQQHGGSLAMLSAELEARAERVRLARVESEIAQK